MKKLLFELIEEANNADKNALLKIIFRFNYTIKKFSRDLKYDGAESDLVISLIEIIKEINLLTIHIKSDGAIVNFIYRSLYNRKIDLYRKNIIRIKEECNENLELLPDRSSIEAETRILFQDVLKALSTLQRDVILLRYYKDYSDREISEKWTSPAARPRGIEVCRFALFARSARILEKA